MFTFLILVGGIGGGGGEELKKWCQLGHHQLMSQPRTPHSTAKTNDKKEEGSPVV